jgi:phosphate-selective porin
MRIPVCIFLLLLPAVVFAQNPAGDQDASDDERVQDTGRPFQINFKNRPSIRIGEFANVDFKAKWHFDFLGFDPPRWNPPAVVNALPTTPPTFYLTRARFGLKGRLTKYFDYEVERDMRQTFGSDHEWHPWKDNYVNAHLNPRLEVMVGKFKLPFGMESNLSEDRLDFAFKSRVSDILSPARERGAMLHGTLLEKERLTYAAGVFRYDGEGSDIHGQPTAGRTYATRFAGEPLRSVKLLPKTLRHTYVGAAMTRGRLIDGLNGVHGQTFSNFTYFDHMYVRGDRTRIGTEVNWKEGPFDLKGEYIHMSEERINQGIRGETLPDSISRGWYAMGTVTPFGKLKSSGKPKDPFLVGHGFGALEFSARFDVLAFYSAQGPGLPTRSPRAPTILPNGERTWTIGPTWYVNHFVKIQVHGQREHLTDIERKAILGHTKFLAGVIRLQLAM